jgi:hypothetical protein
MNQFNWEILQVDYNTGTMVVRFQFQDKESAYNINIPPVDQDLSEWIQQCAPKHEWFPKPLPELAVVEVGQCGHCEIVLQAPTPSNSDPVPTTGSWDEEYLRAVIYSVLAEIEESRV